VTDQAVTNGVKLVSKIRVKNGLGIHTRPATAIVKLLHNVKSNVSITYKKDTVNAKSILSILMLALHKNAQITVTVEGIDAEEVMSKLLHAFETCFGES
jgi:phosphocarrier protein